jgi:hypothetical protein
VKKNIVLDSIGQHFSNVWVASQRNLKLEGFKNSAEFCRRNLNMQRNFAALGWFAILAAIVLCSFGNGDGFKRGELSVISGIFIAGLIILLIKFVFLKTGETRTNLVRDWKPIRRRLLRYGVIQNACFILREDKGSYLSNDQTRRLLVEAFDSSMETLFSKLHKAEVEGFPKMVGIIKDQILDLKKMTWEMGLLMTYREDGTPSKGSIINCVGNPRDKRHSFSHGDPVVF